MTTTKTALNNTHVFLKIAPFIDKERMDELKYCANKLAIDSKWTSIVNTPIDTWGNFDKVVATTEIAHVHVEFFIADNIIHNLDGADYIYTTMRNGQYLYFSIDGRTQQYGISKLTAIANKLEKRIDAYLSVAPVGTDTLIACERCQGVLSSVEVVAGFGLCAACICSTQQWRETAESLLREDTDDDQPNQEYDPS